MSSPTRRWLLMLGLTLASNLIQGAIQELGRVAPRDEALSFGWRLVQAMDKGQCPAAAPAAWMPTQQACLPDGALCGPTDRCCSALCADFRCQRGA